MNSDELIE